MSNLTVNSNAEHETILFKVDHDDLAGTGIYPKSDGVRITQKIRDYRPYLTIFDMFGFCGECFRNVHPISREMNGMWAIAMHEAIGNR